MKKALILLTAAFILFSLSLNFASAEFWQRDEERVRDITRPEHYTSEKHDRLPTTEPTPQPTESQPTQVEPTSPPTPTVTPVPAVGGVEGNGDNGDEGGNDEGNGGENGEEGEAGKQEEELVSQVSAPSVLGLSDTSSGGFALSDIMLLAGALCLTLYLRSKTEAKLLQ